MQIVVLPQQSFLPGETLSEICQVTSGPARLAASLDASGYVAGTTLEIGIQWQQAPGLDWEETKALVSERGSNLDGSPCTAWVVGAFFDGPLPETTLARLVVRVQSGPGIISTGTVSF